MQDSSDVHGRYELQPTGRVGFPWATLQGPDGPVAEVGRYSALNLFLLRGQRIRLPDGRTWRLKGSGWHRFVCPMLVDRERRTLAMSAPGHGNYAVTCRDRGFSLIPAEKRAGRPRVWDLVERDHPIARIGRNPYFAEVAVPTPLPAILMSFGLAAFGVMGEKDLVPSTPNWT
jgi:hypothetical protein